VGNGGIDACALQLPEGSHTGLMFGQGKWRLRCAGNQDMVGKNQGKSAGDEDSRRRQIPDDHWGLFSNLGKNDIFAPYI
jgi:hypothetical protein